MTPGRLPPHFVNSDHRQRCLEQLRSKGTPLEKYIYLDNLKDRTSDLFYDLLIGNMKVCDTR